MYLFGYTDDQGRMVEWTADGREFQCTMRRVVNETTYQGGGRDADPSKAFQAAAKALDEWVRKNL